MGAPAAIRLIRTFHRKSLGIQKNVHARTYNPNGAPTTLSTNARSMLQSRLECPAMKFGLLPEFSTPVQKPVEIAVLLPIDRKNCPVYGLFSEAKACRARFEATSRILSVIRARCAAWR